MNDGHPGRLERIGRGPGRRFFLSAGGLAHLLGGGAVEGVEGAQEGFVIGQATLLHQGRDAELAGAELLVEFGGADDA